jgi:predicted ABC-type ATPase
MQYTPERTKLHDKIMGEMIAGVNHEKTADKKKNPSGKIIMEGGLSELLGEDDPLTQKVLREGLSSLTPEEKDKIRKAADAQRNGEPPNALFMAGGPASGKTSALKQAPELKPDAAVSINSDDVKVLFPEFQAQLEAGEKGGASSVHEESSDVAKKLVAETMDLGLNLVMDGTGNSKPGKFMSKLNEMHDSGYEVDVLAVTIPTDDAVVRAMYRARESGRWVPEPEIRKSHKLVSENMKEVLKAPQVRSVTVYDNGGGKDDPAILIGKGEKGSFSIANQSLYDEFLAKADEPAYVPPSATVGSSETTIADTPSFREKVAAKTKSLTDASNAAVPSPASPGTIHKYKDKDFKVLADGSVDVEGDVAAAADLLGQGEKVRLSQADEVSILLNELSDRVNEAKKLGKNAPNYNLCNVTVAHTNLFCEESKGIPRVQMPQLAGFPTAGSKADKLADEGKLKRSTEYIDPDTGKGGVDMSQEFIQHLLDKGFKVTDDTMPASHLRASQNELNGPKVAEIAKKMKANPGKVGPPTLVSKDNYIVDGHHRVMAAVGNDAEDGVLGNEYEIPVRRVDIGIIDLLAEAHAYADEMGLPVVSMQGKEEKKSNA